MPPCRRDLAGAGPYKVVQVGEKTVDFNPNFRLFMTTRNAHPDIPPDARDQLYKNRSSGKRKGLCEVIFSCIYRVGCLSVARF